MCVYASVFTRVYICACAHVCVCVCVCARARVHVFLSLIRVPFTLDDAKRRYRVIIATQALNVDFF